MKKILQTILVCMALMLMLTVCTVAADFSLTSDIPKEISVSDAKTKEFLVSGIYDADVEISLSIKNTETKKIVLYQQTTTDENGIFTIGGIMSDNVVCGTYELRLGATHMAKAQEYYFDTFEITNESMVKVSAIKGTVNVLVNGEDKGTAPMAAKYPIGTQLTYTAVADDENKVFLYWMDSASNMILSESEALETTVGSDASYMAIFSDKAENEVYVTFKANNKILASTFKELAVIPKDPYITGYTFDGWYIDGSGVKVENLTFDVSENTLYVAGFKADATEYDVTISGATTESGKYKYNHKVTVVAAGEEGKVFNYWLRDGIIVSYSEEYSFYVSGATNVVAYYAESAPEAKLVLVMAAPVVVETNKIAFYAERNVPENYTVIETGILMNTSEEFDINTKTAIKAKAKLSSNIGQYTVRKANVSPGDTWYAKAYVIYSDGENVYTVYSDTVSKTL